MTSQAPTLRCDECGSPFIAGASPMASLCAECAHVLYGYPSCPHEFAAGRCTHCGWNSATSAFVDAKRKALAGEP